MFSKHFCDNQFMYNDRHRCKVKSHLTFTNHSLIMVCELPTMTNIIMLPYNNTGLKTEPVLCCRCIVLREWMINGSKWH